MAKGGFRGGYGGMNQANMMKQAQKMQQDFLRMQKELEEKEFTAKSGGGMVSDYTSPALGRFWATFAVLSGYVMLIACDGGTQLVMGGLTLEQVSGIPQWVVSIGLLAMVLLVNIFDVGLYGKVEGVVTVIMMIIYLLMSVLGAAGAGTVVGAAVPVAENATFLPEGGWVVFSGTPGARFVLSLTADEEK